MVNENERWALQVHIWSNCGVTSKKENQVRLSNTYGCSCGPLYLWQPKTLTAKIIWKNSHYLNRHISQQFNPKLFFCPSIFLDMYYIERHDQLNHPKTLQHTKVPKTNQVWPGKLIYLFSLQRVSIPTSSWSRNSTFTAELTV